MERKSSSLPLFHLTSCCNYLKYKKQSDYLHRQQYTRVRLIVSATQVRSERKQGKHK